MQLGIHEKKKKNLICCLRLLVVFIHKQIPSRVCLTKQKEEILVCYTKSCAFYFDLIIELNSQYWVLEVVNQLANMIIHLYMYRGN
jgi:hypothetical protein